MKLEYNKVESSIEPKKIDESLSSVYVYIRKNIVKTEKNKDVFYEYDEAKLTHDEYKQYLNELSVQKTLEDIEKLQTENKNLSEQINSLTECLLEMSEMVYA